MLNHCDKCKAVMFRVCDRIYKLVMNNKKMMSAERHVLYEYHLSYFLVTCSSLEKKEREKYEYHTKTLQLSFKLFRT